MHLGKVVPANLSNAFLASRLKEPTDFNRNTKRTRESPSTFGIFEPGLSNPEALNRVCESYKVEAQFDEHEE